MDEQTKQLKELMESSNKTTAVTGSGISYMYGMGRLKKMTNRMDMMRKLSPQYVRKNPEDFYKIMREAFLDATFKLGPSQVHKQLAEFEQKGMLFGIVTQNLDCLHQLAGSTNVAEIVGGFDDNVCVECDAVYHDVNVWNEGKAPRCEKCGAPLMPLNFDRASKQHDNITNAHMKNAIEMLGSSDLILVMGTTGFMSDQYMSGVDLNKTKLVQINPSGTVFDQMAVLNIRKDAAQVFQDILDEI